MIKTTNILGLDRFGIAIGELAQMADSQVIVEVFLTYISEKDYFRYPPKKRRQKIAHRYRKLYKKILKEWPAPIIKMIGSKFEPLGFHSAIKAREIINLPAWGNDATITVISIDGLEKKKTNFDELNSEKRYFSVKLRFMEQVEGLKKGLVKYEDRIILLKASSFEDAEDKVYEKFKDDEDISLVSGGSLMVRWKFEQVLYIYDTTEVEIDDEGTEVFSVYKSRRLKPEYEWHPEYEDDEL